ncbi:unnamed protein product, partial [Candidula unifasciata]
MKQTTQVVYSTGSFPTNTQSLPVSLKIGQYGRQQTKAPIATLTEGNDVIIEYFEEEDTKENDFPEWYKHKANMFHLRKSHNRDNKYHSEGHRNNIYHYYRGNKIVNYHFYGKHKGELHRPRQDDNIRG